MPGHLLVRTRRRNITLLFALLGLHISNFGKVFAAEAVLLQENDLQNRVFDVKQSVSIEGTLQAAAGEGKAISLPLKAAAEFDFRGRRMSAGGRDASSLREARSYRTATSRIEVSNQETTTRLRENLGMTVVLGRREGVEPYSLSGQLSYSELELLSTPGDALSISAMLPPRAVDVGETWEPTDWSGQMLVGLDAVLKQKIECRLDAVEGTQARVTFSGTAEGAVDGSVTNVTISGSLIFDTGEKFVRSWELTQVEKRTVGTVSPGMEVTARVTAQRSEASSKTPWTDQRIAEIPLEAPSRLLRLGFESDWSTRIRLEYDREWHLFHETERVAVFRLIEEGSLISQCNVSPVPSVAAGEHTSEKQFQDDIKSSLGERFGQINSTQQLGGENGLFVYRVAVSGKSSGLSMNWHYYLCAAPSGQQVSFVFAYEPKAGDKLADRDLDIVKSMRFLSTAR